MKLEEVKKNLNRRVSYNGSDIYKLTACILRKGEQGFFYQAELLDMKNGNSAIVCKIDDVGAIE